MLQVIKQGNDKGNLLSFVDEKITSTVDAGDLPFQSILRVSQVGGESSRFVEALPRLVNTKTQKRMLGEPQQVNDLLIATFRGKSGKHVV